VDRWTAMRIRIGGILERHPEFTGKQVLERLGPDCRVRLIWIWHVMSQYHRAVHPPSAHVLRTGRRFHPLWRDPKLGRPGHSIAYRARRAAP